MSNENYLAIKGLTFNILLGKIIMKDTLKLYTFIKPNFLSGASRILDLGATFNNFKLDMNPLDIDMLSIRSDWSVVGEDIKEALIKQNN